MWKCFALMLIALCSMTLAVPVPQDEAADALNPIAAADVVPTDDLEREKRKLPEATFGAKNAILGYVFGKIDGILDAKTKLLTSLDAANVAKNKEYGIEPPVPINSLQALLQAVIAPKIAAISSKFGAFSGGSGGFGASSGGTGAGASVDDDGEHAEIASDGSSAGSAGGSGHILSSVLKLSGPILSSSSASAKGGQLVPVETTEESDE